LNSVGKSVAGTEGVVALGKTQQTRLIIKGIISICVNGTISAELLPIFRKADAVLPTTGGKRSTAGDLLRKCTLYK